MHTHHLPLHSWYLLLVLALATVRVGADEVTIQGDTQVLSDTEATYYVSLDRRYPSIFFFGYEFDIDLSPPVKVEVLANTLAKFSHVFSKVPAGSYTMQVQVYIYFFQQKAWKVGEKSITLQVRDSLDSFFIVKGQQEGLPVFAPTNTFTPNKTVSFLASMPTPNSVLSNNTTILDYVWSLEPNSSIANDGKPNFDHNFTQSGEYKLNLEVTANITSFNVIKKGKISNQLYIKSPITNLSASGNPYVENGSLLQLNVSCNGSSNFQICFFFSDTISNKSCLDQSTMVTSCFLHISHYFPHNGTQYINIGVRNDVSETTKSDKIIIYKVGPKPSLVFVILPLVSSFLVIIIILIGIAHHIKQRRRLNATIEVATMENFGVFGHSYSLSEKTFFERIQDSLKGLFQPSSSST